MQPRDLLCRQRVNTPTGGGAGAAPVFPVWGWEAVAPPISHPSQMLPDKLHDPEIMFEMLVWGTRGMRDKWRQGNQMATTSPKETLWPDTTPLSDTGESDQEELG